MRKDRKSFFAVKLVCLVFIVIVSGCSGIEYRAEMPKKQTFPELEQTKVTAKLGWIQQVGFGIGKADVKLSLASTDDVIVVCDAKGQVVAIDRITGKSKWKMALKIPISAGPTVSEDKIFLGTRHAEIIALELQNGNLSWRKSATSEVLAAPVVHDGVAFIHSLDGGLLALNVDNGRQLWRFSLNIPPLMLRRSSAPVVTANYVVSGFASGKLVAINRLDGSIDWVQDVSTAKGRSDIQRMIDVSADPIVSNEIVYVIAYQGNLAAFALNTGQPLWSREISSYAGMTLENDILYVSAIDGGIFAIDRFSGNTLWHQPQLKGRKLSKPIIHQEFIVVGDDDGYLHWLSAEQGQLVGRLKVGSKGIEAAPKVFENYLYVYDRGGKVSQVKAKMNL